MDASPYREAIDKHISALSDTTKGAVGLSLIVLVSGMGHAGEIDLLGLKIPRSSAVFACFILFLYLQLTMVDKFLRVRAMFAALPDDRLAEVYRDIGLHPWSANPFALIGPSPVAISAAAKSLGVLLFAHILMNSWVLSYGIRRAGFVGVLAPFVLPGMSILLLLVVRRIKREIRTRLARLDSPLADIMKRQERYGRFWFWLFLAVGLLFYIWILSGGQTV